MNRKLLPNDQWERIKDLLPGKKGDPGKTGGDNRLFIEAVLWIARTGSPWRDLPPAFGNYAVLPLGQKRGLETFAGTGLR